MTGDDEAEGEQENLQHFIDQRAQRVGENALEGDAALAHRGDDTGETRLGQHDAGRRLGDVGRGRDGDADLRLAQRRRVVGAVAAHADGVAGLLKRLDQVEFVFRQHAGEDAERVGAHVGRDAAAADGSVR